jgi:tetratricopeptide (TPR) repeat protein
MKGLLAAAVLAAVASSALAETPAEKKQRADKLFDDGRRYLQNKEYALACTAFEQSQEADPAIGTQLNIALCYEDWGHFAAAYAAFQQAAKDADLKHDNRGKVAQKKIAEIAPKVPYLTLEVPPGSDASAVFLMDGKELDRSAFSGEFAIEVGPHEIEVRVPGQPAKTTKVDMGVGEHKHVAIDVPKIPVVTQEPVVIAPPPRNPRRLYGGIACIGAGAIAIGVGSYVALIARSDYNDAIINCPGGSCLTHSAYNETQNARSRANKMSFVVAGGVALAAVGTYLVWTSAGERPAKVAAAPVVAPGFAGIALGGGF